MTRAWIACTVTLNALAVVVLAGQFLSPGPALLHAQAQSQNGNDVERPQANRPAPDSSKVQDRARNGEVQWDGSEAVATYVNVARVTGTPQEVVLDFGLNIQTGQAPRQSIKVQPRLVLSYITAKQLTRALGLTVQRHESDFGPAEAEPRRRSQPQKNRPSPSDGSSATLDHGAAPSNVAAR